MKLIRRAERKNNIIGEAVLLPVKEGVIPVDEWVPDDEDVIVGYKGKQIVVLFDKILHKKFAEDFNYFDISYKEAYYNQLKMMAHYANYFLKFYDQDHELIMAYLKLKHQMDMKYVSKVPRKKFIKNIQRYLFSDSMCEKISRMSKDNYRVDLSEKKGKASVNKKYAPVLQFTEHHAEVLMRISIGIKFAIPVVLHFIKTFYNKDEVKNHLYQYFKPIFKNPILIEDVNVLGKIYKTISTRVNGHLKPDRSIYNRHEALGSTQETFTEELFNKNLITDTVFSYCFNGNIVSYNSVILRYQLGFHSKEDLKMDHLRVTMEKDPEGLSGLDKMEMYMTKIDVFTILFSQVNIADTLERIKSRIKIKISPEEFEFYKEHHDYNNTSNELVFNYFAKYFGGFRDLYFINREQYVYLIIIMKKMLIADGSLYMSYLASANVIGKSSTRIIRNSKFLEKVRTSSTYINLMEKKYPTVITDPKKDNGPIITLLSTLINTNWSYVEYEKPERLGEQIEFDNERLAHEFLRFVARI